MFSEDYRRGICLDDFGCWTELNRGNGKKILQCSRWSFRSMVLAMYDTADTEDFLGNNIGDTEDLYVELQLNEFAM